MATPPAMEINEDAGPSEQALGAGKRLTTSCTDALEILPYC
jgi:hypothetical protein